MGKNKDYANNAIPDDDLMNEFDNIEIPEVVDLPDISDNSESNDAETPMKSDYEPSADGIVNEWWTLFTSQLNEEMNATTGSRDKTICRIDSEIVNTFDELDILGARRHQMINAILRSFITLNLQELKQHRRIKKTLL